MGVIMAPLDVASALIIRAMAVWLIIVFAEVPRQPAESCTVRQTVFVCMQSFKSDPQLQHLPHTVIASWYQRRGYVTAMADLIQQSLQQFQEQVCLVLMPYKTACLSWLIQKAVHRHVTSFG